MKKALSIGLVCSSLLLVSACSQQDEAATQAQQPRTQQPAAEQKETLSGNRGRVLNSMNAGGYTYVEMETANGTRWLAGPIQKTEKGDIIRWGQGAVMTNFKSSSLDRTFEEILFVSGFLNETAQARQGPAAAWRPRV